MDIPRNNVWVDDVKQQVVLFMDKRFLAHSLDTVRHFSVQNWLWLMLRGKEVCVCAMIKYSGDFLMTIEWMNEINQINNKSKRHTHGHAKWK